MKKTLLFVACFTAIVVANSQQVSGKLNFVQGQSFDITIQTKTTVAQEVMGQAIDFNMDGGALHSYKVTNVTAENSTLHHDVKKIEFAFDGMGQKRNFSSDNPKDLKGPIGKPIGEYLARKFDIIVDTSGKVLMLQPEKMPDVQMDEALKLLTNMLKDVMDAVEPPKKGGPSFFKLFPDEGVAKGGGWNEVSNAEGNKFSRTYTLTDITDSTFIVDFTGTASTVTKAEMMGMETVTTMNDKTTGKIIIDKASGIIREKAITTESTGTTEAMGSTVPVTSKTTISIKVTPVKE